VSEEKNTPSIVENYKDFSPSFNVLASVKSLLTYVPSHYLNGLEQIVLKNSSGLNRKQRRKKTISRKWRTAIKDSLGLYYQKHRGIPAHVVIFVDNIEQSTPVWVLKISFLRNIIIASTLYHEIGHHIHKTIHPEYKEREDVADEWRDKLLRLLVKRRYWYLKPVVLILKPVIRRWKG